MSYSRSNLVLGGKRYSVAEVAAMQNELPRTIDARLRAGWTRRQIFGLDAPPLADRDFCCDEITRACARYERERGERIADRALEGDIEALGTLAGQGVRLWGHCNRALLGSQAQAEAARNRPTREVGCGCTVDSATGITVRPCVAHKDESVRRARRREVERERKLAVVVNVVRGL